jgi:hypothetical protein
MADPETRVTVEQVERCAAQMQALADHPPMGRVMLHGSPVDGMLRNAAEQLSAFQRALEREVVVREQIQKWCMQSRATQIKVMRRGGDGDPLDAEQCAFKAVLALLEAAVLRPRV